MRIIRFSLRLSARQEATFNDIVLLLNNQESCNNQKKGKTVLGSRSGFPITILITTRDTSLLPRETERARVQELTAPLAFPTEWVGPRLTCCAVHVRRRLPVAAAACLGAKWQQAGTASGIYTSAERNSRGLSRRGRRTRRIAWGIRCGTPARQSLSADERK